jgi:glucose/arabinose dehydrogenase
MELSMPKSILYLITLISLSFLANFAGAQDLNWAPANEFHAVEQNDHSLTKIREDLKKIELPPDFHISVFAIVPNAAQMAVSPQGVAVFASTRKGELWAIADRNKDRVADEVVRFTPGLLRGPSGICFSKDGFLYAVEKSRVLILPAAELAFDYQRAPMAEIVLHSSFWPPGTTIDGAHTCEVRSDSKLYIWLEQGGIIRIDRDGRNPEFYQDSTHVGEMISPNMLSYSGSMFPDKYRNGIFSVQDGEPTIGARIIFTSPISKNQQAEVFAEGWPRPSADDAGSLVDIAQLHDGSILISDQQAGAIYRIMYRK